MATLLQSPPRDLSLADVATISQTLAEDLSRLVLKTEGFSVEDYLSLDGPYLLEFVEGSLQILPKPDAIHQAIAFVLANLLLPYAKNDIDARVKLAPFPVYLKEGRYREPDICFMRRVNAHRRTNKFWTGADLVVEIISESNRDHDLITKVNEYAAAGIHEYWIVDPDQQTIQVLSLAAERYRVHGNFGVGDSATSPLLAGFSIDLADLFRQANAQA